MAKQMPADQFKRMFEMVLTDRQFQKDLATKGLRALEARGFELEVPPDIIAVIDRAIIRADSPPPPPPPKPPCPVCGVCGACGLCAELNVGSAAAALVAVAALAFWEREA